MSNPTASSRKPTEGFWPGLERYWFGYGSPASLGVFRILIGVLACINFALLWPFWQDWYGDSGYLPVRTGQLWLNPMVEPPGMGIRIPRLDLINGVTDSRVIFLFLVVASSAAVLTTLGLWTRISTVLLAIGIVSLHHRSSAVLHGGDTVLRVMTLYLAISPCGNAFSLDRFFRRRKGLDGPELAEVSLWPQRLITYNVALVYFTTVWLKWDGSMWRNGTATYYPARLGEFHRFPVPAFFNELPMVTLTTYGTLLVEFCLATLVFYRPLRRYVLIAGMLMHLYIDYSMNIPLFSYLMIATYVCFYDGEEVSAWLQRRAEPFFGKSEKAPIGDLSGTP